MSHLREMLEAFFSGVGASFDDASNMVGIPPGWVSDFMEQAESAMAFDMGNDADWASFPVDPKRMLLPFDRVWFEYSTSSGLSALLIHPYGQTNEGEPLWQAVSFCRPSGGRSWILAGAIWFEVFGAEMNIDYSPPTDRFKQLVQSQLRAMSCFLTALHSPKHVVPRLVEPSAALAKARKKRGKKPLFSYWVLNIEDRAALESSVARGRTHASPRLHLRRSHFRQYKSGKIGVVKAHTVGDKKSGIVHKEYRWWPPEMNGAPR